MKSRIALDAAEAEDAEDAEDVAIYDARKADLASGKDELLPSQVSMAILKGDTRMRAIRLALIDYSKKKGFL